ncbi:hypothetical protein UFOVP328_344 [uncultured Caudovirales phage]|uniref:Uncharacterized protein n=1 Tax=uncultured Caudovirales phage TaxID=2100421 RepID=A0A6J5LVP4_9CAUD|nr:hypothetical protein UFOVP328_344 [uncultured Caudovirales phage]
MWPADFAGRLESWNRLREQTQNLDAEHALQAINSWWFGVPWRPYYLHWDDIQTWPDPWQLLSDNYYCDLARALGILYTITLLDRADLGDATMVLTETGDNLVLVSKSKYILNWDQDTIVNTIQAVNIKKQLTQSTVKQQYL